MRYLLIIFLCFSMMGCRTTGKHWLLNKETGELELVEQIEMRGTAKHEIDFATKGGAKADSGFRVPDFPIKDIEINN